MRSAARPPTVTGACVDPFPFGKEVCGVVVTPLRILAALECCTVCALLGGEERLLQAGCPGGRQLVWAKDFRRADLGNLLDCHRARVPCCLGLAGIRPRPASFSRLPPPPPAGPQAHGYEQQRLSPLEFPEQHQR